MAPQHCARPMLLFLGAEMCLCYIIFISLEYAANVTWVLHLDAAQEPALEVAQAEH